MEIEAEEEEEEEGDTMPLLEAANDMAFDMAETNAPNPR